MLGRSFVGLVLIAGLAVASTAAAQDPIKSNPKVYHLVFENSTVRVLHVSVAPGQKTVLHEHPDNAVVVLTDSKMRFTGADGKSQDAEMKARDAMWSPAGKHFGENIGAGPIEAVIVELKGNSAPTGTIPTSRPDVTITQLFDNPRARAIKAVLQPAFHEAPGTTHDFDQVVIALAPAVISLQLDGKPAKTSWKAGDAEFIGRGVKHESKNNGQDPADVFILAIK
jgi:quercetin dioxygenase-like cupin family protein